MGLNFTSVTQQLPTEKVPISSSGRKATVVWEETATSSA
jgi:hypothetical protein